MNASNRWRTCYYEDRWPADDSAVLALAVGVFYTLTGGWAFMFPADFYSIVATFSPYNVHLIHDAGAFQVGLGIVLVAASIAGRGLVPVLIGVLAGSLLHMIAHVIDIHLGGHPGTAYLP